MILDYPQSPTRKGDQRQQQHERKNEQRVFETSTGHDRDGGGLNVEHPSSGVRDVPRRCSGKLYCRPRPARPYSSLGMVESFDLFLKCSARSTQLIRHRRTAPQAPRNRIRANADNRKASGPFLFERLWQPSLINIYRKPVSGVFRHNAFWFRGLWRKPGQHFAVRGKNPAGFNERAPVRHRRRATQWPHRRVRQAFAAVRL